MNSTESWWKAKVDWETPAGRLLLEFASRLPADRRFEITIYGSAPLQLTVDRHLLSADVDIFASDDEDLTSIVENLHLDKTSEGFYLEPGFELSFRTSPRWRGRAKRVALGDRATLVIPHPIDILIGKLHRLDAKDLKAFERVIALTGHPAAEEFKLELRNAVDLFRPDFDEAAPNRFLENTKRLWKEIFNSEIDVKREIIEPAIAKRRQGFGEPGLDYKSRLGNDQ